jgi:ADP-ribose pyrophosphatase YjhB (NUDIX family)
MDDDRRRSKCPQCDWIHYLNPTVGVAVVLMNEGKILLGKRRDGGWCIPCGHVEWDENVQDAAIREFKEETGLTINIREILAVHSNFHDSEHHTVGVWFRGEEADGELIAGGDLEQVGFFPFDQLPDLKFPTDQAVIQQLIIA